MAIIIELNPKLAGWAEGVEQVEVNATTVQEAVVALARRFRSVGARIFNCEGALRGVVKVEVNGAPIPVERAETTTLSDGDRLSLAFP